MCLCGLPYNEGKLCVYDVSVCLCVVKGVCVFVCVCGNGDYLVKELKESVLLLPILSSLSPYWTCLRTRTYWLPQGSLGKSLLLF